MSRNKSSNCLSPHQKRSTTIVTNKKKYDEFVEQHKHYYITAINNQEFVDIYDGKTINLEMFLRRKLSKGLFEKRNCVVCGEQFNYNYITQTKWCSSKSCISLYSNHGSNIERFDGDTSKIQQYFEILQTFPRHEWVTFDNYEKIRKFYVAHINNYDAKTIRLLYRKIVVLYKGKIIRFKHADCALLIKQGVSDDCTFRECTVCGSKYLFETATLHRSGKITLKRVGALWCCGKECYKKCRALYPRSQEYRTKLSNDMKQKIMNGEFTPCVTNSYANSRCYVDNIPFRSTWEAYFYLYFKHSHGIILEYEKIRIPYTYEHNKHTYIIDFAHESKLYEIKPEGKFDDKVRAKESAAKKYAYDNGLEYLFISNDWFHTNYDSSLLNNVDDKEYRHKMRRNLKQFEGEIR